MGQVDLPCPQDQRRIASYVGLVAEELRLLHGSMEQLQETLAAAAADSPAAEARHREFQDVDRMTQTVEQLALFLARLADAASGGLPGDVGLALSQVSLGALQSRLAGLAAPPPGQDHGTIDLF